MDERVWLRHPTGRFHCPVDAVPAWLGMGWEPEDPAAAPEPAGRAGRSTTTSGRSGETSGG